MMTLILLYFAVSLLASLVIYGACLAAARADRAIEKQKENVARRSQPKPSVTVE